MERILRRLIGVDQQGQVDELLKRLEKNGFERQVIQRDSDQVPDAEPTVTCQKGPLDDIQERRFAVQLMLQTANRILNLSLPRRNAPVPTYE